MKFKVREAKLLEHIYEKGAEEDSLPGQTVVKAGEGERKKEKESSRARASR